MGDKNNQTTGNSTEIDSLTLNIEVKGADSGKSVRSLATAISRLNDVLKDFNNEKFSNFLDTMSTKLNPFLKKVGKVSRALESLSDIVKKTKLDDAMKEMGKMPEIKTKDVQGGSGEGKPKQSIGVNPQQLGEITDNLKDVNKEVDKLDKKSKKSTTALGKLVKSFGRIAMYRAVRRTIQEITQAFTESIDGIARYNSEFRDTMGSLQSSMAKLKTSIGVGLYQVLIALEPVITAISNGIVNLANSLSKVTANLRGVAEYTKINTEYMKDYQSAIQGALLPFDTFNTLSSNQGIDYSKMLDTGTDADSLTVGEEKLKNILSIFGEIANSINEIWVAISPSMEPILDFVSDVLNGVSKLVKWLSDNNLLTPALIGVLGVITALASPILLIIGLVGSIIDSFSKMSTKTKVLTGIVAGLAAVLAAIVTPGGAIAKITAATITFAGISAIVANAQKADTTAYANGGMFEGAGTMYALAGESGAEVVATGSAGTGVLNVDQFADAMVSALVRYGAARDTSNGTTIVLDGNKVGQLVASNVGFRNEANRRNAGLNWK